MMSPMKVTHTVTYEAPASEVYAMLVDPDFRRHAARATGVTSVEVEIRAEGEGHVVRIDQVQPTAGVPAFARKFAGESTRVVQVETWATPLDGTLEVQTPGRPAEITGSYTLEEDGDRTRHVFDGQVKAKVPLIRDRLEKLMAELFTQGRDKEQEAGAAWLRGERD